MIADSSESDPFDFMERLSECPTPVEMSEAVKVAANVSPEFEMIVRRMAFQIDRMTVSVNGEPHYLPINPPIETLGNERKEKADNQDCCRKTRQEARP